MQTLLISSKHSKIAAFFNSHEPTKNSLDQTRARTSGLRSRNRGGRQPVNNQLHKQSDYSFSTRALVRPNLWSALFTTKTPAHPHRPEEIVGNFRREPGYPVTNRAVKELLSDMSYPVITAYGELLYFDYFLVRGDFRSLYDRVRNHPIAARGSFSDLTKTIPAAIDMACIWYWKRVLCLQRSAAMTCMLKNHGLPARMVIGAQKLPFKAHAWVEIDGRPINERTDVKTIYAVWDRC